MANVPLFLRPAFQRRLWGGTQLRGRFGYDVPDADGPVGECWGVSARPEAPSTVVGGPHDGRTLGEVWEADPGFFGRDDADGGDPGRFPLLVKFLDAAAWLSVQVHPDDAEAAELEGAPEGKTECWYVVAAEPGAELIIGHRAGDRDELAAMVAAGRWDDLLLRRPVRAGDFVYVPSGTVHAVGPGLLVCEVQQNSDTTYRVYDFDRVDAATGEPRALHLDKSLRVLTAPYDPATTDTAEEPVAVPGGVRQRLVDGAHFTVTRHTVDDADGGHDGGYAVAFPTWALGTVVDGSGSLAVGGAEHPLRAGDHLVLPADAGEVRLTGDLTVVTSHPPRPTG